MSMHRTYLARNQKFTSYIIMLPNTYFNILVCYTNLLCTDFPHYVILVRALVESVIGGSVCTHVGAKARPSPQTDTKRFASL